MRTVNDLYAWVMRDGDGSEGVLRRVTPIGTQPLIADSIDRAMLFESDANEAAAQNGAVPMLVHYSRVAVVTARTASN